MFDTLDQHHWRKPHGYYTCLINGCFSWTTKTPWSQDVFFSFAQPPAVFQQRECLFVFMFIMFTCVAQCFLLFVMPLYTLGCLTGTEFEAWRHLSEDVRYGHVILSEKTKAFLIDVIFLWICAGKQMTSLIDAGRWLIHHTVTLGLMMWLYSPRQDTFVTINVIFLTPRPGICFILIYMQLRQTVDEMELVRSKWHGVDRCKISSILHCNCMTFQATFI